MDEIFFWWMLGLSGFLLVLYVVIGFVIKDIDRLMEKVDRLERNEKKRGDRMAFIAQLTDDLVINLDQIASVRWFHDGDKIIGAQVKYASSNEMIGPKEARELNDWLGIYVRDYEPSAKRREYE